MTRGVGGDLARLAVVLVAYFVAGRLGLALAFVHPSATPVWPPTGIAVASVLLLGIRAWPAILAGAFLVNFTAQGSVVTSAAIAAGNTLEAILGGALAARYAGGAAAFERPRHTLAFVGLAGLLGPAVSATVGVTSLVVAGSAARDSVADIWLTWWLGDAAGAVIVTPLIVLWRRIPAPRGARLVEAGLVLLGVFLVSQIVFGPHVLFGISNVSLTFLSVIPLAWAAFRLGPRETSVAAALTSVLATWGTLAGHGPFALLRPNEALLLLQVFVATVTILTIPMAAVAVAHERGVAALQESEAHFRALADAVPVMVWMSGSNARVTYVNRAWLEFTGVALERELGDDGTAGVHPEDRDRRAAAYAAAFAARQPLELEYRLRRADGAYRWVLDRGVPRHGADGAFLGYVGGCSDIHDRREVEEERMQLLHQAEHARAAAEAAGRIKDEFLATLSHELRTPLTSVLGWARLLQRHDLDDATRARAIGSIERNATAQAQLIEDLLDVSSIVTDQLRINREPVDLASVVQQSVDLVRPAADAKQIAIDSRPGAAPQIAGDARRLQQVVWNLLSNAVKFTPAGGRIDVVLEATVDGARLTVGDSGKGIDPGFLPHIFQRFRQQDSSTTRAFGGLGLGLAIVRHLVELHGGHVSARNREGGGGAVFVVHLPISAKLEPGPRAATSGTVRRPHLPDLHGVRVVIVDDDPESLELLAIVVRQCGASAETAVSVTAGIERLQTFDPHVVVCDIAMPGEDGFEFMRRLQGWSAASRRRVPAIAVTAYASQHDRARALEAGFLRHLAKPVDPVQFCDAIAGLVQKGAPTNQMGAPTWPPNPQRSERPG